MSMSLCTQYNATNLQLSLFVACHRKTRQQRLTGPTSILNAVLSNLRRRVWFRHSDDCLVRFCTGIAFKAPCDNFDSAVKALDLIPCHAIDGAAKVLGLMLVPCHTLDGAAKALWCHAVPYLYSAVKELSL